MAGTKTRSHARVTGRVRPRTQASAAGRTRRHLRVRKKVTGSAIRPRLVVNRSARHMFAQVVDDTVGTRSPPRPPWTRRSAPPTATRPPRRARSASCSRSAPDAGIEAVVFDRGGYRYHGRFAALADGAREGGLKL